MRSSALLLLVVVSGGALFTNAASPDARGPAVDPLPRRFEGYWLGNFTTPVGPLHGIPMAISALEGSGGTKWLIRHDFQRHYSIATSQQQFWVTASGSGATATSDLTYCGALNGFFVSIQPSVVYATLTETKRNETYIEWFMSDLVNPLNGSWWFQLTDDGNTLLSSFEMPVGVATHVSLTYKRVTEAELSYIWKDTAGPIHANGPLPSLPPPCNFTFVNGSSSGNKLTSTSLLSSLKETTEGNASPAGAAKRPSRCPFGFGSRKQQQSESKNAVDNREDVTTTVWAAQQRYSQHCYVLNRDMKYVVAWNWSVPTGTAEIEVSADFEEAGLAAASRYVAIGFYPVWPLMQGMDVVLGYMGQSQGEPCVRDMYAQYSVGTPVDSTAQELNNKSIAVSGSRLTLRFSRPWKTGHTDLSNPVVASHSFPVIAFATGRAPGECSGDHGYPGYHYGNRGVYAVWWPEPTIGLPNHMRCDAQAAASARDSSKHD